MSVIASIPEPFQTVVIIFCILTLLQGSYLLVLAAKVRGMLPRVPFPNVLLVLFASIIAIVVVLAARIA